MDDGFAQPRGNRMAAYAHSLPGAETVQWELVEDHLAHVASLAARFAQTFSSAEWGRLLGRWHDIGKYSEAFQRYLRASAGVDGDLHHADVTEHVDHSTAGAQLASTRGPLGMLLAYCIAGHHAGLPDAEGGSSALRQRLKKDIEPYDAAPRALLTLTLPMPPHLNAAGSRRPAFATGFWVRMLFSCLVDADFVATESFMSPARAVLRPSAGPPLGDLLAAINRHIHTLAVRGAASESPRQQQVNALRAQVLQACREKAQLTPGLFSLNVPTGGGKTLSSLVFALEHATHHTHHQFQRVIYAIPFTSIIEQTSDVFRRALADLGGCLIEHHSNLDLDDPVRQTERSRLAAENFDAPLIVTTNVQLFESLFASRTSRCRKLHRLAHSVIILDEAQTLPPKLLAPTLAALQELVTNYGTTVVLCTATQPAVEERAGFSIGLRGVRPIIDDPHRLHDDLRRTEIVRAGTLEDAQLVERLRRERQVLCIVNSRGHAAALYRLLADPAALHLSASMCGRHRAAVLRLVRRRLRAGRDCRLIATQVIEAGVDVDFPAVYRAAAGLDSIAQAAGRCNREGRLADAAGHPQLGKVTVFEYDEEEKGHKPPPEVATATAHFRHVAPDHADLLSPDAIDHYFQLHYWQQGGDDGRGWDQGRGGLSVLDCFGGVSGELLHHQFRTAAERYQLIPDAQTPVLVPYGRRGKALLRELLAMPEPPDPQRLRRFDRAAQRYTVGMREHALGRLCDEQVLICRHERYALANQRAYDGALGLTAEATGLDPEMLTL